MSVQTPGMGGGMRPRGPPRIQVKLVQKPARAFQQKLEMTLRGLKKRGFQLYQRCKKESSDVIDELRVLTYAIKKE